MIGAARSGTTILQNALNHAPEIFMLGETQLHLENGEHNFAARYNSMHERWRNQATKSTRLPQLITRDRAWDDHFAALGRHYRWVGSKIVVNAGYDCDWIRGLLNFHNAHFHTARYVFTFRDPLSVIRSTANMRGITSGALTDIAQNYAQVLALFTHMARTMPHVRAEFHEDMDRAALTSLGDWLGVSLDGAADYYQEEKTIRYELDGLEEIDQKRIAVLGDLYKRLRAAARTGFERPQVQHNDLKILGDRAIDALALVDRGARFMASH